MSDIVERLRNHASWYISCALGNVPDEAQTELDAADEIQRLRAEVEELRTIVAKPAVDRAETRESLFPELSARIAAERGQAAAEAMERAAQIVATFPLIEAYNTWVSQLDPEQFRQRLAAAIRAEASKKGGEG